MGELRTAGRVADGKGAAVRRAQPGIDDDPGGVGLDPGGGEIERGEVGSPTGGDQQMRPRNPLAGRQGDGDAGALARDPGNRDRGFQRDAVLPSRSARAPPAPGRRAAAGPASITVTLAPSPLWACASSMPIGPPPMTIRCRGGSVGEHHLVGKIRHAVEARDRRHDRRSSRWR
jgi:hypothetical protein